MTTLTTLSSEYDDDREMENGVMTTKSDEEVFYCPVCEAAEIRPAASVVVRCAGVYGNTGPNGPDPDHSHWPTEMARIGSLPAESPQETLERVRGYVDLSPAVVEAPGPSQPDRRAVPLTRYGRSVEDLMSPEDRILFKVPDTLDGAGLT